jgi:hypothetical protein
MVGQTEAALSESSQRDLHSQPPISCVVDWNSITTLVDPSADSVAKLPDFGYLIGGASGLFLLSVADNGKFEVVPVDPPITGAVHEIAEIPGVGDFIDSEKGSFLAQAIDGQIALTRIENVLGFLGVTATQPLDSSSSLILSAHDLFWRRRTDTGASFEFIKSLEGEVRLFGLSGQGVFVASALDKKSPSISVAYAKNGAINLTYISPFPVGENRWGAQPIPGIGILLGPLSDNSSLLFASVDKSGAVRSFQVTGATGRPLGWWVQEGTGGILFAAERGFFTADPVEETVTINRRQIPGLEPPFRSAVGLPGVGVLIGTESGLSLVRISPNALPAVEHIALTQTVGPMFSLTGIGALVSVPTVTNGFVDGINVSTFLVHPVGEALSVEKMSDLSELKLLSPLGEFAGLGYWTRKWEYYGSGFGGFDPRSGFSRGHVTVLPTTPWRLARVEPKDRNSLNGSSIDKRRDINVVLEVEHVCAATLQPQFLKVIVTSPDGKTLANPVGLVTLTGHTAEIPTLVKVDRPGLWRFQVIARVNGKYVDVGNSQTLNFTNPNSWAQLAGYGSAVGVFILFLLNTTLFVAARRSPWAWRIATADTLGTLPFRIVIGVLSSFKFAQIWVLDLYYQRQRLLIGIPEPFLPLPVTGSDGHFLTDYLVAPPWDRKRLWVQGNSGMGKTALIRSIINLHFRSNSTAFEAFAHWGCIVVAFAARDYATGGEDKHEPDWVVFAVKATLARQGLTFEDERLLRRVLLSGVIGVVIDGLHEAGRSNSVEAFAQSYASASIVVTSQEPGTASFQTVNLPNTMRDYSKELLQLLIGDGIASQTVYDRVESSGLLRTISSGYDLRLISDLTKDNPATAILPRDRPALYAAVLSAGWPDASEEVVSEQMAQVAAAAWRLVSERGPHEDKRRIRPGIDLPADLLNALADAPERSRKPVRLVSRLRVDFEFVHDQMHAYLAARWFAQSEFSMDELEELLRTSTIWKHSKTERQSLWGFVAALLSDGDLIELWRRIDDQDEWDVLRRELKAAAARRTSLHLPATLFVPEGSPKPVAGQVGDDVAG